METSLARFEQVLSVIACLLQQAGHRNDNLRQGPKPLGGFCFFPLSKNLRTG